MRVRVLLLDVGAGLLEPLISDHDQSIVSTFGFTTIIISGKIA